MKTKKLILFLLAGIILFSLSSCEKENSCFPIIWKVGSLYDATRGESFLTITFSAPSPIEIEAVRFESWWHFKNGDQSDFKYLTDKNFDFSSENKDLFGVAKTSSGNILIKEDYVHIGTSLEGYVIANGRKYDITQNFLPK